MESDHIERSFIPLAKRFEESRKLFQRIESNELLHDSAYKKKALNQLIDWLGDCESRIDSLSLFSSNEDLEDVSTSNLKYLLVPYMQGEAIFQSIGSDRLCQLKKAGGYLSTFSSACEQLGLLTDEDRTAMQRDVPADAATRRNEKIARFKRQRSLQKQLDILLARNMQSVQTKRGVAQIEKEEDTAEEESGDREAWLLEVSVSVCKALELLDSVLREESVLAATAQLQKELPDGELLQRMIGDRHAAAEEWHKTASTRAAKGGSPSMPPITCATFAQDVIEGRASVGQKHKHHSPALPSFGPVSMMQQRNLNGLQTNRERLLSQVFQPSHSLPGMSIEQAGDKELEIMNEVNKRNEEYALQAAVAARDKEWGIDKETEAAEYKARAWDDWKDEHPKGIGNSKLTPCG